MKRTVYVMAALATTLVGVQAEAATVLAAYDVDSNTGTTAGAFLNDISGHALALDAEIQADSTVVVDATRPGAAPGNQVLNTGQVGLGAFSPYDARLDTGANGMTFAFWAKHENTAAFQAVFGRGPFAERIFNQGGTYALAISNGANAPGGFQIADLSAGGLNDGEWHHVAISLDLSNPADPRFLAYTDGVLSNNLPADNGTGNLTSAITGLTAIGNGMDIAGRQFDNGDRFPGAMVDDLAMFSGVLTADEVAGLASGQLSLHDFRIPEPASFALAGIALLLAAGGRSRR